MKNKVNITYITGLVTTMVVFTGILFKVQHWPGAGYILILGILMLVFAFLPAALISNYKARGSRDYRILYIVTWITCFVVFTAMLFKVQHWPGAGYLLMLALPFPYIVFLPVFLIVTGRDKSPNIYNTVAVLFLLALISAFSALLSLSVSKERTLDSLTISSAYNRIEKVYAELPPAESGSQLIIKADQAIKLVDEYREIIFAHEGITEEQWVRSTEILMEPGNRKAQKARSFSGREGQVHGELQAALSDMIVMAESDPGLKALAPRIKTIFNMVHSRGEGYIFADPLFKSDVRPWVHAYLDGLEVNLKLIRATL
jgi:hypothetical protein